MYLACKTDPSLPVEIDDLTTIITAAGRGAAIIRAALKLDQEIVTA